MRMYSANVVLSSFWQLHVHVMRCSNHPEMVWLYLASSAHSVLCRQNVYNNSVNDRGGGSGGWFLRMVVSSVSVEDHHWFVTPLTSIRNIEGERKRVGYLYIRVLWIMCYCVYGCVKWRGREWERKRERESAIYIFMSCGAFRLCYGGVKWDEVWEEERVNEREERVRGMLTNHACSMILHAAVQGQSSGFA